MQRRQKHAKNLEYEFKEVNRKYVMINKKKQKRNNKILTSVVKEVLELMKETDGAFKNMRPRLEFIGSYYDGLRVGHATEYDLNVVLKLPVNYKKIVLDATHAPPGYTHIKLPAEFRRLSKIPQMAEEKGFKRTEHWCDQSFRFSARRFRSWMQGVLDGAMNKLPIKNGSRILKVGNNTYKVNTKMSGPACTLFTNENDESEQIDIDLVPTFAFNVANKPIETPVSFEKVKRFNNKYLLYFVVPKPTDDEFSWRLAFPFQERVYIKSKQNMKSTIKLMKLLRDVQGFDSLASYFIKTIFLQASEANLNSKSWEINSMSCLFIHMMKILQNRLDRGIIENFWCPNHNLLENISKETLINWSNRVGYIVSDIERNRHENPSIVFKYFSKQN